MKIQFFLAVAVVMFSLTARADFRRLTDLTCTDEGNQVAVRMAFDSSISPYVAQVFEIYGDEATNVIMTSAEHTIYSGMAGNLPFEFTAQNKKKFQSVLMIDNSARKVSCKVKTRFRI